MLSTIGAPHMCVTRCSAISAKIGAGSTRRRQTCVPPTAVTAQVYDHPLQWNIGSVHRYTLCAVELERERIAQRVEVRAAMVIDDALRIAGRARGVEQAHAHPTRRAGRATRRQGRLRRAAPRSRSSPAARRPALRASSMSTTRMSRPTARSAARDRRRELAVGQEHLRFAVLEAECDGRRVEPVVERVQDGAQRRDRVVRLEHRRHVRRHHRDGVAAPDAAPRERGGEAPAARFELAIGAGQPAVPDRDLVRPHERGALEEAHRRQRHEVRHVGGEPADEGVVGRQRRAALGTVVGHRACRGARLARSPRRRPPLFMLHAPAAHRRGGCA